MYVNVEINSYGNLNIGCQTIHREKLEDFYFWLFSKLDEFKTILWTETTNYSFYRHYDGTHLLIYASDCRYKISINAVISIYLDYFTDNPHRFVPLYRLNLQPQ